MLISFTRSGGVNDEQPWGEVEVIVSFKCDECARIWRAVMRVRRWSRVDPVARIEDRTLTEGCYLTCEECRAKLKLAKTLRAVERRAREFDEERAKGGADQCSSKDWDVSRLWEEMR